MRHALLAFAALLALPSAANACSCMDTDDPGQLHEFASEAAKDAIALVEVEAVRDYDPGSGTGEEVRLVRTLAGSSAKGFRIERRPFASSASCDDLLRAGQRAVVILYPATSAAGKEPRFRISGLCTNVLLKKPAFRDSVASQIGIGERG
ncbi:MAG TPA: hypothetical protein VFH89_07005 [Sphingomicrobium sp.]|nr:hypothetical protein [Sphingomicrobium sp.]